MLGKAFTTVSESFTCACGAEYLEDGEQAHRKAQGQIDLKSPRGRRERRSIAEKTCNNLISEPETADQTSRFTRCTFDRARDAPATDNDSSEGGEEHEGLPEVSGEVHGARGRRGRAVCCGACRRGNVVPMCTCNSPDWARHTIPRKRHSRARRPSLRLVPPRIGRPTLRTWSRLLLSSNSILLHQKKSAQCRLVIARGAVI